MNEGEGGPKTNRKTGRDTGTPAPLARGPFAIGPGENEPTTAVRACDRPPRPCGCASRQLYTKPTAAAAA